MKPASMPLSKESGIARVIRIACSLGTSLLWITASCGAQGPPEETNQLEVQPVGQYGSVDGDLVLRRILGITLSQGTGDTLMMAQFLVSAILVLGANGDSIDTIGRAGSGPGEFQGTVLPTILNDTLWVADIGASLKRFLPGGEYIDESRLALDPLGPYQGAPRFVAPLADGSLLYRAVASFQFVSQGNIEAVPWVRVSRDGSVLDTLTQQRLRHSGFRLSWGESAGFIVGIHPADDSDRIAVDPLGRWIVEAVPAEPSGQTIAVSIVWRDLNRTPLASHQIEVYAIPSDDAFSQWITDLATSHDRPVGQVEQAAREQVPWPESLPAVKSMFADNDGRLWLATPHTDSDSTQWVVMNRERGIIGAFALPATVRLHAAKGETLWGSTTGSYDEPYVVRYRVES